jgi:hypothetical protein
MSRIVKLQANSGDLDKQIKQLNEELKKTNEKIIDTQTIKTDNGTVVLVSISESTGKSKNILLD